MLFDVLKPLRLAKPVTRLWSNARAHLTRLPTGEFKHRVNCVAVGFVTHDLPQAYAGYGGDKVRHVPLVAGSGWLLGPGTEIDAAWQGEKTDIRLEIDAAVFASVNGGKPVSFAPHYGYSDPTALNIVSNLVQADQDDAVTNLYRETMTLALAAHIVRGLPANGEAQAPPQPVADPRIARAIEMIEAESDKALPIGRLANAAGLSEFAFIRAFKKATGEPPHRFLMRRRIERAKVFLRTTRLAIAEISHRVGWENVSHFTAIFKQVTGVTPGKFREATA